MENAVTTRIVPTSSAIAGAATVHGTVAGLRMGYLLSQYPAVSHTFLLHEVLGMRALGLDIETASINQPDRPIAELPAAEQREAGRTEYIKSKDRVGMALGLLASCFLHPGALLRGIGAVVQLPRLTLRQRALWLMYLAEAMLVGRWMRAHRLQHLHVHFGGPVASVGMLTAIAWGVTWSVTIHGPEELLNTDAYHLREKISHVQFAMCISDFCRSQLCMLLPPNQWDKLHVIRLGVDPDVLVPSGGAVQRDIAKLVCIGRLVPAKGHRILLEALVILRDRGRALQVTLIGGGPEQNSLRQFVDAHNLHDAVTFTGPLSHDQALEHLRDADIFTLASFAEGIPVALMEAMALGVVCVSTTVAGIPDLISSGVDGLLVPPANSVALSDALETLIVDPSFRVQLGAAGRRRVLRQYNLPINHVELSAVFRSAVAQDRSATR